MKISKRFKALLRPVIALALVITLAFGYADGALAASGGRIGGGSFRAPARSYSPPSRTYSPPGGGYYPGGGGYYPGGGGFFPFVYFPFFGTGGGLGGVFSLLILISVAGFLVNTFRRASSDGELDYGSSAVSVAKVQVGLLAQARELKADLDRIGERADTETPEGLAQVLQEVTLALLRNPQYWVYGIAESSQARLEAAGAEFNRLALSERSKFNAETFSNVSNQLKPASSSALTVAEKGGALAETSGEYIIVTLLVGTQGQLQLPAVNGADDLRRALSQLGSVSSDQLLALEVLWTPQAEGDVLTRDDLLSEYPNLKMI